MIRGLKMVWKGSQAMIILFVDLITNCNYISFGKLICYLLFSWILHVKTALCQVYIKGK